MGTGLGPRRLGENYWAALEIRLDTAKHDDPDRLGELLVKLGVANFVTVDYGRIEAIVAALVSPPRSTDQPPPADVADGRSASPILDDGWFWRGLGGRTLMERAVARSGGYTRCASCTNIYDPTLGHNCAVRNTTPERAASHYRGCPTHISALNACTCDTVDQHASTSSPSN